jgi:hypothetical protein
LFNGTSLEGWDGNKDLWSVEDGAIMGRTKADTKLSHNTFLVYKGEEVSDFELRLTYRIVNGNSCVQYRSKVLKHGTFGPIVGGIRLTSKPARLSVAFFTKNKVAEFSPNAVRKLSFAKMKASPRSTWWVRLGNPPISRPRSNTRIGTIIW